MTQILHHFCKNRGSDESAGSPVCSGKAGRSAAERGVEGLGSPKLR